MDVITKYTPRRACPYILCDHKYQHIFCNAAKRISAVQHLLLCKCSISRCCNFATHNSPCLYSNYAKI